MRTPEQAKAPNYPRDQSQIEIGPMECGMLEYIFTSYAGSRDGDSFSWPALTPDDNEMFTITRHGASSRPIAHTDWYPMSRWSLDFQQRKKTLLIDTGSLTVVKFDGESLQAATYEDVSDIVAAYFNLDALRQQERASLLTKLG